MKMVLLITFSLLFFSCARKNKRSTVKLHIANGAIVNGVALDGDLMIMGKSRFTAQSFELNGHEDVVLELDKGEWDFFAIGWEGTAGLSDLSFTGQVRCSYHTQLLEAADETVTLELSNAKCLLNIPAPHNFYPNHPSLVVGNNVPELVISSCMDDISIPATYDSSCSSSGTNEGLGKSFMIKKFYSIGPENGPQQPLGMEESVCITPDNNTTMRLPLGDPNSMDGLPSWNIYSFTEPNCLGDVIEYKFDKGLVNGPEHPDQNSTVKISGGLAYLLLEHNPQTVSDNGQQLNFFWGTGADGSIGAVAQPNDYYKISDFSLDGRTITTATTPSMIYPGDEIIWYVNDVGSVVNCGFTTEKLKPGMYGWGRVVSTAAMSVTLEKPFNERPDSPTNWEIPSATALTGDTAGSSYCSMQIIRVPNYENFLHDYSTPINTITGPMAYNHVGGVGGIFIIKVRDTFTIDQSTTSVMVKAFGKGMVNRATPDYSHCGPGGPPCLRMGGSATTADGGGGAIAIFAKNFAVKDDGIGGMDITIRSNGGTINAVDGLARDAGDILIRTENFNFLSDFDFSLRIGADAQNGGQPAMVRMEYCNIIGTGTLPTTAAASGTTGAYDIQSNPPYCP